MFARAGLGVVDGDDRELTVGDTRYEEKSLRGVRTAGDLDGGSKL
jgi:hypothetical protein